MNTNFKCGLLPSPNDERDYLYRSFKAPLNLPSKYETKKTKIKMQNPYGFCVGFATSTHKESQELRNHPHKGIEISPLFIQYECKKRDGIPHEEGTFPRVALDVLKEVGACEERYMPYTLADFPVPKPPQNAYENAKNYKIKSYAALNTLNEIKQAIIDNGTILAGVFVTDTFMRPENGFINHPQGAMYGGHAIGIVGWDDNLTYTFKNGVTRKGFLRIHNSWDEDWGSNGYAWLPYSFYDLVTDFGMPWFMEAWTSVDIIMPNEPVRELTLWIDNTKAIADGRELTLDQAPIVDSITNRSLVPLKFVSEIFGQKVKWVKEEAKIEIGDRVKLWIGKEYAEVNGRRVKLDQPPVVDSNSWRTLMPLKFVSEVLGYSVQWVEREKKIIIKK